MEQSLATRHTQSLSTSNMSRLPTPPTLAPSLVLCADGGGSKVCVVIRTEDGIEVRGTAGPCNVVGFANAAQAILLATYRALSQLPCSYLPSNLHIPPLPTAEPGHAGHTGHNSHPSPRTIPSTPFTSRPPSPHQTDQLPPVNVLLFSAAWLGLAGVNTTEDAINFTPFVQHLLNVPQDKLKVSNDVNLLAAPALDLPGIQHVLTVVCGTGTVGRTLRIDHQSLSESTKGKRKLPLEDVAVSRGWGYLLCDEGSAFWIGRLAVRALLSYADRHASSQVYSSPTPPLLPFYQDLMTYFGTSRPMDLIELISHSGRWVDWTDGDKPDHSKVAARRNAMLAGAARIVLRWAFPEDVAPVPGLPPSPPASTSSNTPTSEKDDPMDASQQAAHNIAKNAIAPLIELTMCLLGDQTIVRPSRSALSLGGGLMMSQGYRGLLLDGLKMNGVELASVQVVSDAAGVGALGLSAVEFGK